MREPLRCLRCGEEMQLIRREYLQLGKTGWLSGDWGNLLAGALDVDILCCDQCGKLEFFRADWNQEPEEEVGSIAKVTCPRCGHSHDMDDPKCPYCGTENTIL